MAITLLSQLHVIVGYFKVYKTLLYSSCLLIYSLKYVLCFVVVVRFLKFFQAVSLCSIDLGAGVTGVYVLCLSASVCVCLCVCLVSGRSTDSLHQKEQRRPELLSHLS